MRNDTRTPKWPLALILMAVLALTGSCDFLGALQDPADPNSPNYQGYIVVDSPSKVVPMAPEGELNHPPTLYSAKLLGGISYRFQICSDESFASPEFEKEQSSNIFTPADWVPSLGAGSYRFRVQAKKDTTWGPWSANQIFTITAKGNVATPTFSIPTGSYAASQQVTITSATAGSLIRYTTDGTNPSVTNGTLYSAPVQITTSLTLKAIAYRPGWQTSEIASASYTVNGAVLPPSFSPNGGTYTSARNVNITSDTPGASIRYTTDGSTPTETTGTLYTTTVAINTTSTLKAIAYKSGWTASTVTTAEYIITGTIATPTISPAGGIYTSPQQVTITSTLEGASIRYTMDGSTPSSTTGIQYSGPFTVASSCTVRAIAFKTDWLDSGVASAEFTITGTVAVPSFSPSPGTFTTPQTVTLTTNPSDATIRYTTDGSIPTKDFGIIYNSPLLINSTTELKALAYKANWATSYVSEATYEIIKYKVIYDGNGNTGGLSPLDNNEYLLGATLTVIGNPNNLEKTHFIFSGWSTKSDGSGISYQENSILNVTGNITLYAKWIEEPKFSITYNGNENDSGSVPVDNSTYYYRDNATILGNPGKLHKDYYAFGGWNTKADGT